MVQKKSHDFQISVERPVYGVGGDPQDSIFPDSNQYMNFDWDDVANIVETGAKTYTAISAQQTAAQQTAAAQANLQAQQAALLAAQQKSATTITTTSAGSIPKWIPWTIVGVVAVAGIVTTIVIINKK